MIPQDVIDTIFQTAPIEEVIGEYVNLKKRGSNYIGLCPFHDEKTPSFAVSPTKDIYKCFGCGKAGNVARFLMDHEQMTFVEAIRFLAEKYKIEIPEEETSEEEALARDKREGLYVVTQFAQNYYTATLFEHDEGRSIGLSYFKERGFREETIKKFQLGYALDNWDAFFQHAREKGYQQDVLQEVGLVGERNGQVMDFFRDRIIFPIHNLSGKVIAFAGRTLKSDKKIPKYINSPETIIYNKSKVLYGAFWAKGAMRKADRCFLVEGYTDVISLHQAGIENVVASSGTSLTTDQVRLIKRYTPNITILYDGDTAGIAAATRGVDVVLEQGLNVHVCILPEGEDPDSFIKSAGSSEFTTYVEKHAQDFIFFKLRNLQEEAGDDPIKKTGIIREVVDSLALIQDPLKRSLYVQQCAKFLDISEQLLLNALNKVVRNRIKKASRSQGQTEQQVRAEQEDLARVMDDQEPVEGRLTKDSSIPQERDLIRLLMQHGSAKFTEEESVAEFVILEIEDIIEKGNFSLQFENATCRSIYDVFSKAIDDEVIPDAQKFLHHADEKVSTLAIDLLTSKYELSHNWEQRHQIVPGEVSLNKDVNSTLCRFLLKQVKKEKVNLKTDLQDEKQPDKVNKLLQRLMNLKKVEQGLAKQLNTVVMG